MCYGHNDNKLKVKNLCDCRVSVLCFKLEWDRFTGYRNCSELQIWSVGRATCTLESLNSGKGKTRIICMEETVQWVIWMVSRRFSVSCNWWSENVLFMNMLFDVIACWLIHTELNLVLGPKNWGELGLRHQRLKNVKWDIGEELLEPMALFTKSLHTAIRIAG
jgi:hypothetical protein